MSSDGQGTNFWRRNIAENFNRLSTNVSDDRQTDDRRTIDGRTTTYSERNRELTCHDWGGDRALIAASNQSNVGFDF